MPRNCVCHRGAGWNETTPSPKRRRKGGGWEDEMAKAMERDRVAQIDQAESDRIRAAAQRAAQRSLSKAKRRRTTA